MSRSISAGLDNRHDRFVLSAFVWRQVQALLGLAIFFGLALAIAALSTWNVSDPSLSYASSGEPKNILGYPGAVFADLFMQFFGLASVIALLPVVAWGLAMVSGRRFSRVPQRAAAWFGGAILASAALACIPGPVTWPLPTGLGGVFGDMILRFPALFTGAYPTGVFATVLGCIIAVPAAWMMVFSAGLIGAPRRRRRGGFRAGAGAEPRPPRCGSRRRRRGAGRPAHAVCRGHDPCLVHQPGARAPPLRPIRPAPQGAGHRAAL
jgi:S-DNA-T family DNA segregation ATPase FtsK/SpoIIIE